MKMRGERSAAQGLDVFRHRDGLDTVRVLRMPDRHVTGRIEHVLVHEDPARRREVGSELR